MYVNHEIEWTNFYGRFFSLCLKILIVIPFALEKQIFYFLLNIYVYRSHHLCQIQEIGIKTPRRWITTHPVESFPVRFREQHEIHHKKGTHLHFLKILNSFEQYVNKVNLFVLLKTSDLNKLLKKSDYLHSLKIAHLELIDTLFHQCLQNYQFYIL